jgi:hypothetical protein
LTKSSLCNQLLADGDEDLAVLIARSQLPELLDSERDAAELAAIGLDGDELTALLPAIVGDGVESSDDARMRRTISTRWADLVDRWTAPG